ncbi:MAG: hypothetical protein MK194_03210 [Roseibacillus sp.]|nr:hypothetical protein [Roseibacillus sp.]
MKSRFDDLFEFACGEVRDEDFRVFCPADPGDRSCADLCSGVRSRQEIPEVVDPEWFEVFGVAQRGSPEKASQEGRFVRFKLFCGAVAAKFLLKEPGLDPVVIVNYVCCSLVQCARAISDRGLTAILVDVFPALAKEMEDYRAPSGWVVQEYPFCLLAGMLMAEDLQDYERSAKLAGCLVKAEEQVREESFFPGHEFLLGLTNYDSLHWEWLALAESLENPEKNAAVNSVKDLLGGVEKWRTGREA